MLLFASARLSAQDTGQEPNPQPAQSAASITRVTVQGIVRNSATGEPLARALVQIEGDANTGALTDGEGRFEIANLPVGPQLFRIVKPGFRDRPYAVEEPSQNAEGPAHSVLVAAQMPELDFALMPNDAIRGHIDLSTGDPADGIALVLIKRVVQSGRGAWLQVATTRTNGDGNYRFGSLTDGVYVVQTQPALESEPAVNVIAAGSGARVARSGYTSVFYPGVRDFAGAARIRVANGSQADANFSLALEPFYPVSAVGVVTGSGPGLRDAPPGNSAMVMDAAGHQLPYTPRFDPTTHSQQVSLPDGTYRLLIHTFAGDNSGSMGLDAFIGPGAFSQALTGTIQFTVEGHALAGLRVPLAPPQAAAVHVRLMHNPENTTQPIAVNNAEELVRLGLIADQDAALNDGQAEWSMDSDADTIRFTAQPGSWFLTAFLNHPGVCAGSISAGGFNLAREPLMLGLGAPPPMELTLRDDCGNLALSLPSTLSAFVPGEEPYYTLYVVPDFDTIQEIQPMTMHPSSGPTLTLDSLTPGSYHIYIFDSPVHLEYRNPAVLAALASAGRQVTVSAGTTANLMMEAPQR